MRLQSRGGKNTGNVKSLVVLNGCRKNEIEMKRIGKRTDSKVDEL